MLGAWKQRHKGHVGIKDWASLGQPFLAMCILTSLQRELISEDKREIKAVTEMSDFRPLSATERITLALGFAVSD